MFLLGAGASADAGIPVSAKMINEIEKLLKEDPEWKPFTDLYHHVKSAIYYSSGLKGTFGDGVPYNIETMVNSLCELEKNEEHPLYPFIASWNSRFSALAGPGFANVKTFRQLILRVLKKWMCPENVFQTSYYQGFVRVQNDLNYPLRIFTLNYDTCVERLDRERFRVESGFGGYGMQHIWDFERFEPGEASALQPPQIYLYKIHGSIDWKRDGAKNLYRVEQVQCVELDNMEIIFGRDFKLDAADPYLFYAYEFRRYCLLSKLIVSIGYGFGDAHINKMLSQALRADPDRVLMVVTRCEEKDFQKTKSDIAKRLEVEESKIVPQAGSAKDFLDNLDLTQTLVDHVPKPSDSPF
ncbi:MAG: SIR2 family protein [Isosphaeraceae bacterium]